MVTAVRLDLAEGHTAMAVPVSDHADLVEALAALGMRPPRRVVVVVGGADGLDAELEDRVRTLFRTGVLPVLEQLGAVGVDGGTRSGVMRLLGESRAAAGAGFPLLGVVGETTARSGPGSADRPGTAALEPHHTHFVLVPGSRWGDEVPWISATATALAAASGSATLLVNGGDIAYSDVAESVAAGRRVLVVTGSGRTADEIGSALRGEPADERALAPAATGLVRAAPVDRPEVVAAQLRDILG